MEKSLSGAVTLNDRDFKSSKLSHVLFSLHTHQDLSELSCSQETGRKFASYVANAGLSTVLHSKPLFWYIFLELAENEILNALRIISVLCICHSHKISEKIFIACCLPHTIAPGDCEDALFTWENYLSFTIHTCKKWSLLLLMCASRMAVNE